MNASVIVFDEDALLVDVTTKLEVMKAISNPAREVTKVLMVNRLLSIRYMGRI